MGRFVEDAPGTNAAIDACIGRFARPVAALIREARERMRARFPTAVELVYDNYNFFVIGFCAEARASTCVASIASSSKGVVLSFFWGAGLPDPHGLLLGEGKQHRFLRLASADTLDDSRVVALLEAAAARAKVPLATQGPGRAVFQSVSTTQRPRQKPAKSKSKKRAPTPEAKKGSKPSRARATARLALARKKTLKARR